MTKIYFEHPEGSELPEGRIDGMAIVIVRDLIDMNVHPLSVKDDLHPVSPLPEILVEAIVAHVERFAALPRIDQVPEAGLGELAERLNAAVAAGTPLTKA